MKKQHLKLTKKDRDYLKKLLSKGTLKVRVQKRALSLLELDKERTYAEVGNIVDVSYPTVLGWAKKYNMDGLSFLEDKPRPGRPVGISGDERAKITALACTEPPEGYAKWSLRMLADKVVELEITDGISFKQVGNILKKTSSSPTVKGSGASGR